MHHLVIYAARLFVDYQNRPSDTDRSRGKKATVVPHIRPRQVDQTPFGPAHSPGERSALSELNAMHAISEALSDVPEEETRARVLAWAIRLFTDSHGARDIVSRETRTPNASAASNPPPGTDGPVESPETVSIAAPARKRDVATPSRRRRMRPLLTIRFSWRS